MELHGVLLAPLWINDTALRYAKERVQFGKPIAGFQLQQKLAEMITEITKAQLLAFRLGQLKMKTKPVLPKSQWPKEIMLKWPLKLHVKPVKYWAAWELPANIALCAI